MKTHKVLEIKDNDFLRQFESKINDKLIILEYAEQPRKTFLTKLIIDEKLNKEGYADLFLEQVFDKFLKEETCVIPTCPSVVKFFRVHRKKYKGLLPTGINM